MALTGTNAKHKIQKAFTFLTFETRAVFNMTKEKRHIKLMTNATDIIPSIIFWVLWDVPPPQ